MSFPRLRGLQIMQMNKIQLKMQNSFYQCAENEVD